MSNKIEDEVASLRKQVKTLQAQLNKVAGSCETTKTPTQPKKFDLSKEAVTIIVIGASGDLARKKTYPALFALFRLDLLPKHANIIGYSRSKIEHNDFLKRISQEFADHPKAKAFLQLCVYHAGSYDKDEDYESLAKQASKLESKSGHEKRNRLFYLAIPPSLFGVVAGNIREHLFNDDGPGWNRLVVEKPFGRDMETFLELSNQLSMFAEHELYRIDHYLGKEMVQNLMVLRFANAFLQPVWNRFHVAAVVISFKEPFDVQGRGGYFDEFGIIRDVMQNHLLQILALVAMEPPLSMAAEDVRDEKTKTLRSVRALTKDDVVIGQYCGNDEHEAYRDHEDVPNDSKTPTFASAALYIDNERWRGVPFILKCGKALNERKAEVRIQFRDAAPLFGNAMARNELVLRVQPDAAVYMKIYTKVPGMTTKLAMRELDFTVGEHFENEVPEAYERLLYDVLRGDHSLFVREDELLAAWRIFSPLLHELESADGPEPVVYEYGSRGPPQSDELLKQHGFVYAKDSYSWAGKQKL